MKCKHGIDEHDGITCAYCHPCKRHDWPVQATCPKCSGMDSYGPTKVYTVDDIEDHGAVYWHAQADFWMTKFIELSRDYKKLRQMQERDTV